MSASAARKIKLRLTQPKPRNPLTVPAALRKAGAHRKTETSKRQAQKRALKKQLNQL